jgi:LmbE family N-acetylglucosaminyl deacetylase
LNVTVDKSRPLRVLCLGAHSDDIEIGCGGTVLELLARGSAVDVEWVVFSAQGKREREARASAREFLRGARRRRITVKKFRDGFLPYHGAAVKNAFESLKRRVDPDIVFTHYRDDRHQDHRLLSDLTWNTFRNHLILEYEVPKYDGDLGTPNCFVPLSKRTCARKVEYLKAAFGSQRDKHWFTPDTFHALLRLRGLECRAKDGFAEAFYGRKMTFQSPLGAAL